jgi:hypothetical protein
MLHGQMRPAGVQFSYNTSYIHVYTRTVQSLCGRDTSLPSQSAVLCASPLAHPPAVHRPVNRDGTRTITRLTPWRPRPCCRASRKTTLARPAPQCSSYTYATPGTLSSLRSKLSSAGPTIEQIRHALHTHLEPAEADNRLLRHRPHTPLSTQRSRTSALYPLSSLRRGRHTSGTPTGHASPTP